MYRNHRAPVTRPVDVAPLKSHTDAQLALRSWARWCMHGHGIEIDYPRASPFARLIVHEGQANLPIPPVTDELALIVDKAIADLYMRSYNNKDDHRWVVLTDAYLFGWNDTVIGRRRRIGRNKVKAAREAAESWVESRLP